MYKAHYMIKGNPHRNKSVYTGDGRCWAFVWQGEDVLPLETAHTLATSTQIATKFLCTDCVLLTFPLVCVEHGISLERQDCLRTE
jgi:hypothetical protein